ncbi:Mss4-like protein [Whalleya microplaca]|nr:Mss4-like protein [Whalleya microplaca]
MTGVPEELIPLYNRDKIICPEKQETQTFAARCHCKNIQFTVTIPVSILPLHAYICSCTICRYTHGTFGSFHVSLPQGIAPEWTNGNIDLTVYKSPGSGPGGHGQRWFCATCGAHNGHFEPWISQWIVDISLFEKPFWEFNMFCFPKSPGDGGILSWLPKIGNKELVQITIDRDVAPEYKTEFGQDGEERLQAECCCGGVSFTIPRPSQAVREDSYLRQYISPSDPRKWKAFLDFCRDCRLLSSAHFVPWILVPRAALEPEVPADLKIGTIKTYASSEVNTRGFCGRCGATVFIKSKHRSPSQQCEVLNIAMGILRAPEGAKAENWVTWRAGKPAWVGDAKEHDPEFLDALVEGHKKWSIDKYGDAPDFEVI